MKHFGLKTMTLVFLGLSFQSAAHADFSTWVPPFFTIYCQGQGKSCGVNWWVSVPITKIDRKSLAGYVAQVNEAIGYLNQNPEASAEQPLSPVLQEAMTAEKEALQAENVDTSKMSDHQILESFVGRAFQELTQDAK